MRTIGMLSLAAMLVVAAPASAFGPPQHGPSPEQMFRRADADHDGQVTFKEFKAGVLEMARQRFNRLDRNQDQARPRVFGRLEAPIAIAAIAASASTPTSAFRARSGFIDLQCPAL